MFDRRSVMRRLIERRRLDRCQTPKVRGRCWTWTGAPTTSGYGKIWISGAYYYVHRVSAAIWFEDFELTSPLLIRHRCIANRLCFNPNHLLPGTDFDNVADAVKQCRHRNRGALSGRDVRRLVSEVRRGKTTIAAFAAKKGIDYTTALRAYSGKLHKADSEHAHRRLDRRKVPAFDPLAEAKPFDPRPIVLDRDSDYLAIAEELAAIPF